MDKKLTIGRDQRSDVRIDERWDTVSNNHADIVLQGDALLFTDHSTNGTVINGQKIHNTSVGIYPGDKIMLAGVFQLDWIVISQYFPHLRRPTVTRNIHAESSRANQWYDEPAEQPEHRSQSGGSTGRKTERFESGRKTERFDSDHKQSSSHQGTHHEQRQDKEAYGQANAYSQADIDRALERWNWGAFFCTWLWALVHKTYWPLLAILCTFIPYLGQVGLLCISVYLGLNGSKIAWRCGRYKTFDSYRRAQRIWALVGVVLFAANVAITVYSINQILSFF